MTTKIRTKFVESSKAVSAEVLVESDEMTQEEVLAKSKDLMNKALAESQVMTMKKLR